MIETLTNLKNNKLKRNTSQNQGGEAVERMKKFLSGIGKKRHGTHPPFSTCCVAQYLISSVTRTVASIFG
jgi:hypothetical protein